MKELACFVIKGSPSTRTAQQKGERIVNGRYIHHFEKKEVTRAKAQLADALLNHVPEEPYDCPIYLRVLWLFAKKSLPKKRELTFKTERPDTDNLVKMLKDVMTDVGFWTDDSKVVKEDLMKGYSNEMPGLFIQILALDNDFDRSLITDWRKTEGGRHE